MTFFTSDTHFNHKKICEYSKRPFSMGGNWVAEAKRIRSLLNGRINLILGNHDRSPAKMEAAGFEEVHTKLRLSTLPGYSLLTLQLQHAPGKDHEVGEAPEDVDYVLCGHIHTRWKKSGRFINVGVDVWDFYPQTLEELLK